VERRETFWESIYLLYKYKGTYEFPDGTLYEGEFVNHKMHGEGYYIDKNGSKWEGEFEEGLY
jgi:hypothetical protein